MVRPGFRLAVGLGVGFFLLLSQASRDEHAIDAILVLAGGVDRNGRPHETVRRRLEAALEAQLDAKRAHRRLPIVCNGGGTTHKPRYVDDNGYAVPEAALMARYLIDRGADERDVYLEGLSDDTLGNAYFARLLHADALPEWRSLLIITSQFQMPRTRAIYDWVFSLEPLPAGKAAYRLRFQSVKDEGALSRRALTSRLAKERASLRAFRSSAVAKLTSMSEAHSFIFTQHSAYSPVGVLSKTRMNASSSMAASY